MITIETIKNNYNPTIVLIISILILSIIINSCTRDITTKTDKIKEIAEKTNIEINEKILDAKKQAFKYAKCVKVNQTILNENKNITIQQLIQGKTLLNAIDCNTIAWNIVSTQKINATELEVSNTWTVTGTILPVPSRIKLTPAQLFYTTAIYDGCHVSQTEEQHFLKKNWWIMATDISCRFWWPKSSQAIVFAPDYLGKSIFYKITKIGTDQLLWDYAELSFWKWNENKWVIAHIELWKFIEWDVIETWEKLWQQNLSGRTTGYHTHIELWKLIEDKWINISYSTRSQSLFNKRTWQLDTTSKVWDKFFFTQYNLWDVNQNDASPFIGASGKDLRYVKNPIAITSDIRKLYGLKFWDKIQITGPCSWIYQVEDEMNIRFRTSCILREWWCIKWDIAIQPWEVKECNGTYTISNL